MVMNVIQKLDKAAQWRAVLNVLSYNLIFRIQGNLIFYRDHDGFAHIPCMIRTGRTFRPDKSEI